MVLLLKIAVYLAVKVSVPRNQLNVYSTAPAPPAAPQHVLTAGPYTRIGCYTEGNGTRALSGAQDINYASQTVEKCATFCAAGSYAVMGVEYGGECYCGSAASFAASGSTLAPDTDCNMLCAGSPAEFCGAGNRLDTYQITA
ncbi:putative fungistatic metabolite [Glarea lozoyensis 74030]|uniref:Putative fungistatic metabolite n=1 Tax=Glarea lozoyensis (strain ATCC 74030 / MF5533) TaxID=1104152 RepID=H0ETX5_GLAL7|nr:putative fungistatic metabolite [Glarea lozoyensis 74030]